MSSGIIAHMFWLVKLAALFLNTCSILAMLLEMRTRRRLREGAWFVDHRSSGRPKKTGSHARPFTPRDRRILRSISEHVEQPQKFPSPKEPANREIHCKAGRASYCEKGNVAGDEPPCHPDCHCHTGGRHQRAAGSNCQRSILANRLTGGGSG